MSATTAAAKPKKPAKKPDHPPYNQMVVAAITELKDRTGSSRQKILKHVCDNNNVNDKASKQVTMCLRRLVDKNVLIQTRGQGGSGSFKLNKENAETKKPRAVPKKQTTKQTSKKAETKPRKPRAGKDQADGKGKPKPKPKTSKPKTVKTKKAAAKPAAKAKSPAKSPAKVKKSPAKPKPAAKKPASKKPTQKKTAAKKPAAKGGKKTKA